MSPTLTLDRLSGPAAEAEADGWSARRRLACVVALSIVSWIAILAPVVLWI